MSFILRMFYKKHAVIFWIISFLCIPPASMLNVSIRRKIIDVAQRLMFSSAQINGVFLVISLIALTSLLIFLHCSKAKPSKTEKIIVVEKIEVCTQSNYYKHNKNKNLVFSTYIVDSYKWFFIMQQEI